MESYTPLFGKGFRNNKPNSTERGFLSTPKSFIVKKKYSWEKRKMNQEKIGAFIASLRREKGYTQREVANRLELSEKTISKWECGKG